MKRKPGPGKQYGEGYKYVSFGLTFAGGVIVFMLLGLWVDKRLDVLPLFTIVGTVLGSVLSFMSVYHRLEAERKERSAKDEAA